MATAARKARKAIRRNAIDNLESAVAQGVSRRTNAYKSAKADVDATRYVSPKAGRVRSVNAPGTEAVVIR